MWKYIKYFIPIILAILSALLSIFWDKASDVQDLKRVSLGVGTLIFGAIWYLFFTKPTHKFSLVISVGLFLFILPIVIIIADFEGNSAVSNFLVEKDKIRIGYFSFVLLNLAAFYCLRFYYKSQQEVFSLIKLLFVLVTVILSIVLVFDVIANKSIAQNIARTIFCSLGILTFVHITDMIIWERKKAKGNEDLDSFDDLIEQISGTS